MQDHPSSPASSAPAPDAETWQASWKQQGQPWRSQPPIDEERQQLLASCLHEGADIEQGKYPFKGMRLSRADVEWLLAADEERSDRESTGGGHSRKPGPGLDLRGVDLSGVDLSGLPLMRLHAGLSLEEGRHATLEQGRQAAANLAKADLSYAQVQGAHLSRATLDEAVLVEAHLEGADLGKATLRRAILAGTHLEGADLTRAQMEGATLLEAHLEGAFLLGASLEGANLFEAHLEGAKLIDVHLEGVTLVETHCEGRTLSGEERERLRAWMPRFPETLPAADLRGAFLNSRTSLNGIHAGDDQYGYVALGDVHWGDVNLTVIEWDQLKRLGDETLAPTLRIEEEGPQPGERGLPAGAERAVDMLQRAQEVSDVVVGYVMRSPTLMNQFRERLAREAQAQPETQQQLDRERLQAAVRANRQLAVVLRSQGLNEAADRFAYRAQVLRRWVLRRSGTRSYGPYIFSWLLDMLAGYGYKPGRTLAAYLSTVLGFAIIYFVLGFLTGYRPAMSPLYALVVSIISFHGRGFYPGDFLPTLPMAVCAACEAILGLTIEISFIATFTQRYFGK
ncbi:MAG TPA: pentapeptide repeat-containing protein [Ktedonobacteraceae bacterium]